MTTTSSTTPTTNPLEYCQDVLDHFKCYKTRAGIPFVPLTASLADQFETKNTSILRPYRVCNPADKNDEGINDPTAHEMCYQVRDVAGQPRFTRRDIRIVNQFGEQLLSVIRPETLCVPAIKDGVPSALNLDRFKCYQVRRKTGSPGFQSRDVTLEDQFESKVTTVQKPFLICNPTELDGQPILNGTCHLACYKIKDASGQSAFVPTDVTIEDEFTSESVTAFRNTCRKASLLCVPSLKFEL